MESWFRVVCEPGANKCRRKGPWGTTMEEAKKLALAAGWFHDVQRHGHHGESIDRWFCPDHRKKFSNSGETKRTIKVRWRKPKARQPFAGNSCKKELGE